ncbi:right-handed parallel beta-helix repeat-containing protein [Sphingomonas sp. BT-65]|uniref:rhamnogalacturonidase n=1 Tax=Sphingomonas sp. BT-65 TaxID=2989821 RepID=UPI002235C816|nr:glycosyl hydrolase family 28-related protein [Sphingomonas sp. BT-65]MCW4462908.1 right-handed parallel beta-helix repeat-containing protein [Sphingomonas sp. BT-65]
MPAETLLFDVRDFGARGDGRALDTDAINAVIAQAALSGGTVVIPAGRFLCFSIRLASGVTLLLSEGAVIEAADPARHAGAYDPPEAAHGELFQDFGHSHWRNSLIWGIGLHDIAIVGPGRIEGTGLTRDGPGARWRRDTGERPLSMAGMSAAEIRALEPEEQEMTGLGNKAIALRNCRRVMLRDFTIAKSGHFAVLATGVEDLLIERLVIDTERDGIDLDCVRRTRVRGCRVNSPNDDAIVLKSSYALGTAVACDDVVIEDCTVSGYDAGTMLDGSFGHTQQLAPDRDRVTGRIKLGTESNGGFRNIVIRNCRFERSRGLALETVDGGAIENVTVSGVTMREVTTAPLFIRLGDRGRGPVGTDIGTIRGVTIEDVEASGIDHRFAATIAGLPEARIEDVTLRDIGLTYAGGGSMADGKRRPPALPHAYPEPSMFGVTPAWGLWVRHATGIRLRDVRLATETPDGRPEIVAENAEIDRD